MQVQAHMTIHGTKEAIWSAITNIRSASDIIRGIENIEILEEPAQGLVGLKWKETRMYFGKPAAIDKWVIEATPPVMLKTRAEMDDYVFITTMRLDETVDGIMLTSIHETQPQGWVAKLKSLPMVFFKGLLKKAILEDLKDYKAAADQP